MPVSTDGWAMDAVRRAVPVVLHEHQVPDFDVAVAIRLRCAGRTARNLRTVIVENFGAGAAGAGIAHLPEVVLGGDAREARRVREYLPR